MRPTCAAAAPGGSVPAPLSSKKPPPVVLYLGSAKAAHAKADPGASTAEVESLRRIVAQQGKQLAQLQEEQRRQREEVVSPRRLSGRDSESAPVVDEDDEFTDTADFSDLKNAYSYSMDTVLSQSNSKLQRFQALVIVSGLLFIQVTYVYGFLEGSALTSILNTMYPAYSDPIHISLFYSWSVVEGTQTPLLNCMASVCSLVLLALLVKNDTEGTLLSECPAVYALFVEPIKFEKPDLNREKDDDEEGSQRSIANRELSQAAAAAVDAVADAAEDAAVEVAETGLALTAVIGRMLLCTYLQMLWSFRSFILPVCASIGTAMVLVNDPTCRDIVLDSVAIGFVFELDEFIYEAIIPGSKKKSYEERPPRQSSPLSDFNNKEGEVGARQLVGRYCWLLYAVDVTCTVWFYFRLVHDLHKIDDTETQVDLTNFQFALMRVYCYTRLSLMAVAQVHISVATGYARGSRLRFGISTGATLLLLLTVGLLVFLGTMSMGIYWFSSSFDPLFKETTHPMTEGEIALDCLQDDDADYCHTMHLRPGIHKFYHDEDLRHRKSPFFMVERVLGITSAEHEN